MILNDHVKDKIYHYFIEARGMYAYRRGWMKGDCPSCSAHKFGVNLTLNRTNCFRCGYNLKPIEAIMDIENISSRMEAFKFVSSFDGIEYYQAPIEVKELLESASLPEHYKNISRGNSTYVKKVRNYLIKRGFNIKDLSNRGFGYCTQGPYFGYVIMPFYFKGKLIYFNARDILGKGSKFNNPKVEDFGLGKSMLMYNMDSLYVYDKCYLLESVTNSLTIGDNSFATGGKKLSSYQINYIIKSPCKKIVIGLDKDGILDSVKVAMKLYHYKKVKIMQLEDDRDINDLGKKKSKKIEKASEYLSYGDILRIKNSI